MTQIPMERRGARYPLEVLVMVSAILGVVLLAVALAAQLVGSP